MRRNSPRKDEARVRSISLSLPCLRIEHLWILVPALVVVWMGFMQPLRLLDFWWHLKAGEVICALREIPQVDLFSFTRAGQPFMYQSWLGEVLYYFVYQLGGLPLLIAFNVVLLLLAFIPILHLCLEANERVHAAVLCSLVAAVVLGVFSSMRPQVYSFVLFSAFYWNLWQYRGGGRDRLWLLPLLMAIWVNLHGAFVLGIGLVALVLGTEAIRRAVCGARSDTLRPAELQKLALVLVLVLIASLLNPWGYRVYAYVRQLQVDPASQQFVTEWQVPDITEIMGILTFFAPLFLVELVFFYSGSRLNFTELSLFFTFVVFGLTALRNGIWFALVVSPIMARHMVRLRGPSPLDKLYLRGHWRNLTRRIRQAEQGSHRSRGVLNWGILIGLLLFTVILSPWARPHVGGERLRPELVDAGTPVGAMGYIAEHQLVGNIFHPQVYGDYLIWRLWPEQRTFIDGRVHLYDAALVQDYILAFHDEQWESRLASYDIEYLLLPRDDGSTRSMIEDARASTNWTLLHEDDLSVLYQKQP